jgi:hypothetical protein
VVNQVWGDPQLILRKLRRQGLLGGNERPRVRLQGSHETDHLAFTEAVLTNVVHCLPTHQTDDAIGLLRIETHVAHHLGIRREILRMQVRQIMRPGVENLLFDLGQRVTIRAVDGAREGPSRAVPPLVMLGVVPHDRRTPQQESRLRRPSARDGRHHVGAKLSP